MCCHCGSGDLLGFASRLLIEMAHFCAFGCHGSSIKSAPIGGDYSWLYRDRFDQIIVFVKLETGKKWGLAPSRLFSIKRSYVILSFEHWRKVCLFPSDSNYSQPRFFPVSL
jgi:hypothetical protein